MSSMLEQAIVDANALKEAAIKNAEQALLNKYSTEIKEAVENILEQDELGELEDDELDLGLEDELGGEEVSSVIDDIPLAGSEGERLCPCPEEEEEIEINFDELERQMSDSSSLDSGAIDREAFADDELGDDLEDELSALEEACGETHEEELDESFYDDAPLGKPVASHDNPLVNYANQLKASGASREEVARKLEVEYPLHGTRVEDVLNYVFDENTYNESVRLDSDAELELDEEELRELAEELYVDLEVVPSGNQGANKAELKDAYNIALAKANEDEMKEEIEEFKEKMENLEEANKNLQKEKEALLMEVKKLKAFTVKFKNKLNEVHLVNAKLLYKNRVLNSGSLNERQKQTLAEAIDKAGSVEQAKTVFETLKDAVGGKTQSVKAPKSLHEAIKKSSSMRPRFKEEKAAKDPKLLRMQKLAGIK